MKEKKKKSITYLIRGFPSKQTKRTVDQLILLLSSRISHVVFSAGLKPHLQQKRREGWKTRILQTDRLYFLAVRSLGFVPRLHFYQA